MSARWSAAPGIDVGDVLEVETVRAEGKIELRRPSGGRAAGGSGHDRPALRGIFSCFEKLERGERAALLTPIVLFQSCFVLTSYYRLPRAEAAAKLRELLSFKGLRVPDQPLIRACLDTLTEAGTNVQVWSCGALGGANQRWSVVRDEIRYGSSGSSKCMSAAGFKVVIGSCGTILSRLEWRTDGTIRPASAPGLCVDVRSWTDAQYTAGQGLPANGLDVQLFDCRQEQMNQRWSITGRIRMAASTLCLAREGGADRNGIAVRVGTCSGPPAQTWDYFRGEGRLGGPWRWPAAWSRRSPDDRPSPPEANEMPE